MVADPGAIGEAGRLGDAPLRRSQAPHELGEEAGLADARLPHHRDHLAATAGSRGQRLLQLAQLGLPSDQPGHLAGGDAVEGARTTTGPVTS